MTEKRFYVAESKLIDGYCVFDREKKYAFCPRPRMADCLNDAYTLNELAEENIKIKKNCSRTHKDYAELINCVEDLGYIIIVRNEKIRLEKKQ